MSFCHILGLLGLIIVIAIVAPDILFRLYKQYCASFELKFSDYLSYMGTVIPSSIAIIFSALALKISLYNESILVEASIDVIYAYLEIFYEKFFENLEIKYYPINREAFDTHLRRLVKNGGLKSEDQELCDKIYNHTRNYTSKLKSDDEKREAKTLKKDNPGLEGKVTAILKKLKD